MNKITKKGTASIMAIATLTTSSVGITASAATASDGYSTFKWNRSGTYASVSLTNNSGLNRYAVINAYGYNAAGEYVNNIGNDGVLADNATMSKDGYINGATSITFGGYLYSITYPTGDLLSYWKR